MPSTQTNVAPSSRKTTETFTAGAKSLSPTLTLSRRNFAEEQKKFFPSNGCWLGIKVRSTRSGDYFISEVAGESLIVVRDQRSTIRAFTTFAVIAGRGSGKIRPDMRPQFSVLITHGRTHSTGD